MKIAHVITGLETGGAENALYRLLVDAAKASHEFRVFSLNGLGTMGGKITELGIPVVDLGINSMAASIAGYKKLLAECREFHPAVIQGWMYHANLAVTAVSRRCSWNPVTVWGIRGSLHDRAAFKRRTRLFIRLGAWLSSSPDAIVFNSEAGARMHGESGYNMARAQTIPNGFDASAYALAETGRAEARAILGIENDALVVGSVGRYHHAKGSDLLLPLAEKIAQSVDKLHFLCIGRGMDSSNPCLGRSDTAVRSDLEIRLMGDRGDVPALLPALDVLVNPSRTEGFPNVLAEALLSGIPCVATDVGDSKLIVGSSGTVVDADDPTALAAAVVSWLRRPLAARLQAGASGRRRITEQFSQARCTEKYDALYGQLVNQAARPQ